MNKYRFKGVQFYQDVLSWKEFGRYLKLTGGEGTKLSPDRDIFAATIEKWYADGTLAELFKLILKPYQPNLWQRARNMYFVWRNKVNVNDPINIPLSLKEIARVNADFMLLNSEWIGNLMIMQRSLELSGVLTSSRKSPQAATSSLVG